VVEHHFLLILRHLSNIQLFRLVLSDVVK